MFPIPRSWRSPWTLYLLAGLICALLAGCQAPPSPPTPLPPVLSTRSATPARHTPSRTVAPTASRTPTIASPQQLAQDLRATLEAALPPTRTPDAAGFSGFPGITGVQVMPLTAAQWPEPRWLAFTTGTRAYNPRQSHTVGIYAHGATGWTRLAQVRLPDSDLLPRRAVNVVGSAPDALFLAVDSFSGAHSGCFSLLRFDGRRMWHDLSHCASDPDAARLLDLDGDDLPEAILNLNNDYIFCYACRVRMADLEVWRWQGPAWEPVKLTKLPSGAPLDARHLNDRAVRLAQGELWRAADATIRRAARAFPDDETIAWNARLIDLMATARREQVRLGAYPLLSNVFYGDYAAALNLMRPYKPAQLFASPSIMVQATVADRWESVIKDEIWEFTSRALTVDPNQAGAYFLRGWALYLVDPANREAYALVQRAATLSPTDKLFADSAAYLR